MVRFERVLEVFGEIFPSEIEALVIYDLYLTKDNSGDSPEEFDFNQIKQSIINVSKLPALNTGRNIQVERIFKRLIGVFIERLPGNFTKFSLTPHAEKLMELILNKIDNPYLKFPLKESFEAYFKFPNEAEKNPMALLRWFKLGFQNTARQVVISHLEGLKLAVDVSIKKLNQVLETEALPAIEMLEEFTTQFQLLGSKAKEISEAIRMKDEVYYSIREILNHSLLINTTSNKTLDSGSHENDQNIKMVNSIKEEIYSFFEKVDRQLDIINLRLTFATYKITELQESLRAQSYYKLSLKKLLTYLLEHSTLEVDEIKFPTGFPRKAMVQEKFRLRTLRHWDMGFLRRAVAFSQATDENYELLGRAQVEEELNQQAAVHKLYCEAFEQLSKEKRLDLSDKLFEIIATEGSIEIAVNTAYELTRDVPNDITIAIDDKALRSNSDNTLHLWKTLLIKKENLNS